MRYYLMNKKSGDYISYITKIDNLGGYSYALRHNFISAHQDKLDLIANVNYMYREFGNMIICVVEK